MCFYELWSHLIIPLAYKEVASKGSSELSLLAFSSLIFWTISNVCLAYAAYYDSFILMVVGKAVQLLVLFTCLRFLYLWFSLTAARLNSRFILFDLDKLEMDEYVSMVYAIPVILYGLAIGAWSLSTGDDMWSSHSEMTLLFFMAAHYFMFMSLTGADIAYYLLLLFICTVFVKLFFFVFCFKFTYFWE